MKRSMGAKCLLSGKLGYQWFNIDRSYCVCIQANFFSMMLCATYDWLFSMVPFIFPWTRDAVCIQMDKTSDMSKDIAAKVINLACVSCECSWLFDRSITDRYENRLHLHIPWTRKIVKPNNLNINGNPNELTELNHPYFIIWHPSTQTDFPMEIFHPSCVIMHALRVSLVKIKHTEAWLVTLTFVRNDRHLNNYIFQCIFVTENYWNFIEYRWGLFLLVWFTLRQYLSR